MIEKKTYCAWHGDSLLQKRQGPVTTQPESPFCDPAIYNFFSMQVTIHWRIHSVFLCSSVCAVFTCPAETRRGIKDVAFLRTTLVIGPSSRGTQTSHRVPDKYVDVSNKEKCKGSRRRTVVLPEILLAEQNRANNIRYCRYSARFR